MKVELDLSTTQLEELDKSLTNLLENLTDEQRVEIVKSYINFQFDKLEYSYHDDYWNRDKKEISQFGKELIDGLQNQITNSISEEIMNDDKLKSFIKETVDNIIKDLPNIIEESITKYVVENLFTSRYAIDEQIRRTLYERRG